MITILYDTQEERDNLISFFRRNSYCYDFSNIIPIHKCDSDGSCRTCLDLLIDNCIQDRATYQKLNPFLQDQPKSCLTCANSPICWLATTAAAPAACRHYIKEVLQ